MFERYDYAKYAKKLESMDGDDMMNLEYYLVADMEDANEETKRHLTNLVSLIQNEYNSRGY